MGSEQDLPEPLAALERPLPPRRRTNQAATRIPRLYRLSWSATVPSLLPHPYSRGTAQSSAGEAAGPGTRALAGPVGTPVRRAHRPTFGFARLAPPQPPAE